MVGVVNCRDFIDMCDVTAGANYYFFFGLGDGFPCQFVDVLLSMMDGRAGIHPSPLTELTLKNNQTLFQSAYTLKISDLVMTLKMKRLKSRLIWILNSWSPSGLQTLRISNGIRNLDEEASKIGRLQFLSH